jgi:hypothetical protein
MKAKKAASILIRAFWLGMLLLAFWANMFILWNTRIYVGHAQWFNLSYHEFELFQYGAMILFKLGLLTFFLTPYLALKWVEYRQKKYE